MWSSCKSLLVLLFCLSCSLNALHVAAEAGLPHQHPNPEAIVQQLQRRVNESITRRQLLGPEDICRTGNPIDDCWRCNPNWQNDAQILADCAIGFGHEALGGKGGRIYYVNDPSDSDPENPAPGTLRYGVIQTEPLWILFSGDMVIDLKTELLVSSFKTIDGRGPKVEITGKGCVIIDSVTNVIVHNIHIHHCKPSGNSKIRTSPMQVSERGASDGDGISVLASSKIWIDHCTLSYCTDGLIDVTRGSTAVTVSNNYFSHHEKVMLLGHSDDFTADSGMQVTVAFNHFGEGLTERMPRCRHGYFHVVNNDYSWWGMYAVGGSAAPTINSQGNRYIAPQSSNNKEVTKRMDTEEGEWRRWNWRSEGDLMVNGAFFVTSGAELSPQFAEATSMAPFAANVIEQLTMNAGVTGLPSGNAGGTTPSNPVGTPSNPRTGTPSNPGGGTPLNPGTSIPSNPGDPGTGTPLNPGGTPRSPGLVIEGGPPSPGLVIEGGPPTPGYNPGDPYGNYYPWINGGVYPPGRSNAPPESASSSTSRVLLILLVLSTLYLIPTVSG